MRFQSNLNLDNSQHRYKLDKANAAVSNFLPFRMGSTLQPSVLSTSLHKHSFMTFQGDYSLFALVYLSILANAHFHNLCLAGIVLPFLFPITHST